MPQRILVVDDELSMREMLSILLKRSGFDVDDAPGPEAAFSALDRGSYDLVITDLAMPAGGGIAVLDRVKDHSPDTQVILMTAYASTESAVEAMKKGAYDYLIKPFKTDEMLIVVRNCLEKKSLAKENVFLKKALGTRYQFSSLVGGSSKMLDLYALVSRIKDTGTNVLITGESGTGKEMIAKAIHFNSVRASKPFVTVNCGAIPENLMESELFGHKKGAFTGAIATKAGLFQAADGGTLFLDEIGEIPLAMQVKLLRAIQEKSFKMLGGLEEIRVDVRIIAATNKDLAAEVQGGTFREDLFYRLNVINVAVPPLAERRDDIPALAQHFLEKYSKELGKDVRRISTEAMETLLAYPWPGNVRELENVIERAVALETTNVILPESFPSGVLSRRAQTSPGADTPSPAEVDIPEEGLDLEAVVGAFERRILEKALARTDGVKKEAAKLLNVSFRSMRYRLAKYGIAGGSDDES